MFPPVSKFSKRFGAPNLRYSRIEIERAVRGNAVCSLATTSSDVFWFALSRYAGVSVQDLIAFHSLIDFASPALRDFPGTDIQDVKRIDNLLKRLGLGSGAGQYKKFCVDCCEQQVKAHGLVLLDQLREEALKHDVDYLEASGVDIGGVRFLGCTLWTDFCLFGSDKQELVMRNIQSIMSDYDHIRSTPAPETYRWHSKKKLVPGLTLERHLACRAWLAEKLGVGKGPGEQTRQTRTVVVSHHAPSLQSIALMERSDFSSAAYASNLEDLVPLADLWVHGHTHHSLNYLIHGEDHRVGTVRCNPRGYRTWKGWENAGFGKRCLVGV